MIGLMDPKRSLQDLQRIAALHNLPIEREIVKRKEGWLGKPKGMYQVLWERGYIDPEKGWNDFTVEGRKDCYGNLIAASSLRKMISSLPDFVEEETAVSQIPGWGAAPCSLGPGYGGSRHPAPPQI